MFCCSVDMPIGWDGLSMPIDGCSVCIPVMLVNSKFWGSK